MKSSAYFSIFLFSINQNDSLHCYQIKQILQIHCHHWFKKNILKYFCCWVVILAFIIILYPQNCVCFCGWACKRHLLHFNTDDFPENQVKSTHLIINYSKCKEQQSQKGKIIMWVVCFFIWFYIFFFFCWVDDNKKYNLYIKSFMR